MCELAAELGERVGLIVEHNEHGVTLVRCEPDRAQAAVVTFGQHPTPQDAGLVPLPVRWFADHDRAGR
jgi:hypothetical protein